MVAYSYTSTIPVQCSLYNTVLITITLESAVLSLRIQQLMLVSYCDYGGTSMPQNIPLKGNWFFVIKPVAVCLKGVLLDGQCSRVDCVVNK